MQRVSLAELITYFEQENVDLSRKQTETIVNLYDPGVAELATMNNRCKRYIVNHLFNKSQKERYYSKKGNYLFAEIVMSCIL